MGIYKCKVCNGAMQIANQGYGQCPHCGTSQTFPNLAAERFAQLYDMANQLRFNQEFDKAYCLYETIAKEQPTDPEAFWCMTLCSYGILYVEDFITHRRVPVINRPQNKSILLDDNYLKAISIADDVQKQLYLSEATSISNMQGSLPITTPTVLDVKNQEEPIVEPEKPKRKKKIFKIILLVFLAIVLVVALTFVVIIPNVQISKAKKLLEDRDYYGAIEVIQYSNYNRDKFYDLTVDIFDTALSENNYKAACSTLTRLDRYAGNIVIPEDKADAIFDYVEDNYKFPGDTYWYYVDYDGFNCWKKILSHFPTSYDKAQRMLDFIALIEPAEDKSSGEEASEYLINHMDTITTNYWDLKAVQDWLASDYIIGKFLVGYWSTPYGSEYIEFYQDGGYSTSFEFKRGVIVDGYGFKDKVLNEYYNENIVYNFLKFDIVSQNKIRVYNYLDNMTYVMYR